MPLILICGYPSSGKTTFATQLYNYLVERVGSDQVNLINEESESITKRTGYSDSFQEKISRGVLKSAVNTRLDKKSYIILDSLNYIKGYRYELYCIARAMGTPSCVCHVVTEPENCHTWNLARVAAGLDGYDPAVIGPLIDRFEFPMDKNRWDSPLFSVTSKNDVVAATTTPNLEVVNTSNVNISAELVQSATTVNPVTKVGSSWKAKPKKKTNTDATSAIAHATLPEGAETLSSLLISDVDAASIPAVELSSCDPVQRSAGLPMASNAQPSVAKHEVSFAGACEAVWNFCENASVAAPNSSTVSVPHAAPDLLYALTQTVNGISQKIITHQRECSQEGSAIMMPEYDRALTLHRVISVAEITRLKQQFVRANSHTTFSSPASMGASYVDYLVSQL